MDSAGFTMGVIMEWERDNIRDALVNSWACFYRDMGPGLPDEDARVLGKKIVELTADTVSDQGFDEGFKTACEWFETEYLPKRMHVRDEEKPVSSKSHFFVFLFGV